MSKVLLRLIVVALIVAVVSVVIVMLVNKKSNDKVLFETYATQCANSNYDIDSKLNRKISCPGFVFDGKTLLECDVKISNAYTVNYSLTTHITSMLVISQFSSGTSGDDIKAINEQLNKFYELRNASNGTGAKIEAFFRYINTQNVKMDIVNEFYLAISDKLNQESATLANLLPSFKQCLSKNLFSNGEATDTKSTFEACMAQLGTAFIQSENMQAYCLVHLPELNNLINSYATFVNNISREKHFDEQYVKFSRYYWVLSNQELRTFFDIAPSEKANFISSIENVEKQIAYNSIYKYLGGN